MRIQTIFVVLLLFVAFTPHVSGGWFGRSASSESVTDKVKDKYEGAKEQAQEWKEDLKEGTKVTGQKLKADADKAAEKTKDAAVSCTVSSE